MRRIIIGAALDFGAEGSAYGARTAVTVGVTTYVVIPAGVWLVENDAHTSVVVAYDLATAGSLASANKLTLYAASTLGLVYSDGYTTAFLGDGTGGTGHRSQVLPLA